MYIFTETELNIEDELKYAGTIIIMAIVVLFNYLYYSEKTHVFQGMFLNEFINDKERNKERKQETPSN